MTMYNGKVSVPDSTPRIGLEVRMIDGVPVLFTERGEFVSGQRGLVMNARMNDAVSVSADILVQRPHD